MAELTACLKVEWKLFTRSLLFWFILALALLDAWLNVSLNRGVVDLGYWVGQTGFLYVAPLSLLPMLIGVQAAGRDRALRTEGLIESLPYRSVPVLLAQMLVPAVWFVLLGLLLVVMMIGFWIVRLGGGPPIANLALAVAALQIGMAYVAVLGWAIGRRLSGQIAYLVGFVVWFVHAYLLVLILDSRLPAIFYGLLNIFLIDYRSMGFLDLVWGFRSGPAFWLHQGLYGALTLFIVLLLLHGAARRRGESMSRRKWRGAISLAAAISLFCGVGYVGVHVQPAALAASYARSVANQESTVGGAAESASQPGFRVSDYRLQVRYDQGKLLIGSDLTLDRPQADPVFTLNDAFTVNKVEADGQPALWKRQDDFLHINTNGKQVNNITLSYTGKVMEWQSVQPYANPGRMLVPIHFATSTELYMPGVYGWYPLPGEQQLARIVTEPGGKASSRIEASELDVSPAHYRVEVDYPDSFPLLSNLDLQNRVVQKGRQQVVFDSAKAKAAVLVGGPLQQVASETHPEVRFVLSVWTDAHAARHMVEVSASALAEARALLGDPGPLPLLLAIDSVYEQSGLDEGGVLRVDAPMFQRSDTQTAESAVRSYIQTKVLESAKGITAVKLASLITDYVTFHTTGSFAVPDNDMSAWEKKGADYFARHDRTDSEMRLRSLLEWAKQHGADQPQIDQWFPEG